MFLFKNKILKERERERRRNEANDGAMTPLLDLVILKKGERKEKKGC